MSTLYELTHAYLRVQEMAEESTDLEVIKDTLDSIEGAIEKKAVNTVKVMKNMNSDINAMRAEEKRIADRRISLEKHRDWLNGYIKTQMELSKMDKIKTSLMTISLANNPPKVVFDDEGLIPPRFKTVVQIVTFNKNDIAKELKTGGVIPGVHLEQGKRLSIK